MIVQRSGPAEIPKCFVWKVRARSPATMKNFSPTLNVLDNLRSLALHDGNGGVGGTWMNER
jgi:hypothetical protein